MTAAATQQFIEGGEWISIAPELRPSQNLTPEGKIAPFYLTRLFRYPGNNVFECEVTNYADSNAKVPLVKIAIKGHLKWQGAHPLADGAYNVDYEADIAYAITPLHQGFAAVANKFPAADINPWEVNVTQDLIGKHFPLFGLSEGEVYVDYDLIYVFDHLLFNGSKNVDGRAFDKPENRPTNLQLPLVRKK